MNYYDALCTDIEKALKEGDNETARRLIDEELSMPFTPKETLLKLENYQAQLKQCEPGENGPTLLSAEQFAALIRGDASQALAALQHLQSANVRLYLDEIRAALNEPAIPHLIKNLIVEQCILQHLEEKLEYQDGETQVQLRPSEMLPLKEQAYLKQATLRLSEVVSKNPSFLQQCLLVLINAGYERFPQSYALTETENLVFSVIRYVCHGYEDEESWQRYVEAYGIDETQLETFAF